ncbi:MAG: hypothetical protein RSC86_05765 [Oscillospiraceae bacterium]
MSSKIAVVSPAKCMVLLKNKSPRHISTMPMSNKHSTEMSGAENLKEYEQIISWQCA